MDDHLHILTGLHPSLTLADCMRKLETGSSRWIKEESICPGFDGWQDGYGAFTFPQMNKMP